MNVCVSWVLILRESNEIDIINNIVYTIMFDLFTKKEPNILKYLNADVHTHLLPGVDDGVRDFETALSCINEMKRNGINKIYVII